MKGKCIIWTGTINSGGYGTIWVSRNKRVMAHRAVWEGVYGKIVKTQIPLCIDHLCRTRACINVHHMRLVTNKENVLCGVGYTAQKAKQTHCIKGHELSGDNLTKVKRFRACHTCQNHRNKLYMRRRRQLAKELSAPSRKD